ncbi:hypothetical protein A3K34_01475 [candidate division WWE3 bacterium RIFOXYC1_FULL_40_10]|uniref:Uncharacterized protein n=1 Tax=candidate division WWE3 bacterium RIFOXYA2_FULL_46_9 TaxID=1802636 RepID=A0A1F4W2E5_UNCKA|nr:MAG: hypothetical protein A3K58_01475 [candidate division WWE3 bacterium RIFOXYB1_FULL_40_22]OGC61538.1 MAG: hypothetical protein A3K37_01475 [candidate division WWE3 bacterium RIFOXYA1_FULL_40_11]OGC63586.1 MAG: hypothetical protein A2264_04415 [candidate division WWE3 bacterium RIFOXYA2_FULL_46_9]OGC64783.1 MAG: hypothetical protein A2326_01980 [candidate division WWE3 bacterium RIFOXYB2_FULL_41_6]OGC65921.1 MAG: hypothetical protein A3K34_01475 [candidate division WWE3 bacterium RIFOXYC1_
MSYKQLNEYLPGPDSEEQVTNTNTKERNQSRGPKKPWAAGLSRPIEILPKEETREELEAKKYTRSLEILSTHIKELPEMLDSAWAIFKKEYSTWVVTALENLDLNKELEGDRVHLGMSSLRSGGVKYPVQNAFHIPSKIRVEYQGNSQSGEVDLVPIALEQLKEKLVENVNSWRTIISQNNLDSEDVVALVEFLYGPKDKSDLESLRESIEIAVDLIAEAKHSKA